jgi:hypothetical protein
MKPEPTLYVSVKLYFIQTYTCVYQDSFFLDPEDINSLSLGAIWNFSEGTGLPCTGIRLRGIKGLLVKAKVYRERKGSNPIANQSIKGFKCCRYEWWT